MTILKPEMTILDFTANVLRELIGSRFYGSKTDLDKFFDIFDLNNKYSFLRPEYFSNLPENTIFEYTIPNQYREAIKQNKKVIIEDGRMITPYSIIYQSKLKQSTHQYEINLKEFINKKSKLLSNLRRELC